MKKYILFIVAVLLALLSFSQTYNFEQGVKAYENNDPEKALDYFGREIKDNPKAALSFYYRAIIYNFQEKNASALSDINNSIKYFSSKEKKLLSGAHRLRGDIYLKIENYDKSFDDYATAIKITPDNPEIYLDRAQIYFDLKKYDKAEADYRKALKIDESLVIAWAGFGRNFLNQKNYVESENILNKLIKLSPEYMSGYYYRAQLYYEQKKYDEAIEDIFKCLQLKENDKYARILFLEYSEKNYPLSFAKITAQITANPQKDIWYYIRAQLYEGKYNYKGAIDDYTKMMDLLDISYRSSVLGYRAKCYSESGQYDQSVKDYSESISLDSSNAYQYGYRADAKRLQGNYTGAIEDFSKAIKIEPRESWFYYRKGWIEEEFLHDNEAGLNDYNTAISLSKKYAYTYLNRGRLYELKLKNPEKAKEDYETILSLDTAVREASNCRQYALFHLKRNEESIAWLNKIIEKYPTDGNYYDAACLYSLMNKPTEAIDHMKIALQKGYRSFAHISVDDDLDNIRNLPEFKNLIIEWKKIFDESIQKDFANISTVSDKNFETVSIPMKSKGSGTYEVSCIINDLGLNMIFDTGASDISISQTEVQFMLKNGYLSNNDITGSQKYMDANGDIEIGTTIIFRKVDFGGLVLKNVKASVVHNKNAPLLFGQSALNKYGKITIDNESKVITITTKTTK